MGKGTDTHVDREASKMITEALLPKETRLDPES